MGERGGIARRRRHHGGVSPVTSAAAPVIASRPMAIRTP